MQDLPSRLEVEKTFQPWLSKLYYSTYPGSAYNLGTIRDSLVELKHHQLPHVLLRKYIRGRTNPGAGCCAGGRLQVGPGPCSHELLGLSYPAT